MVVRVLHPRERSDASGGGHVQTHRGVLYVCPLTTGDEWQGGEQWQGWGNNEWQGGETMPHII